ncbi:hypothetical protein FX985_02626 [Pseudomonas extremaustralis]|uniref:Uncharacterized protein n=1 Tax=Pseudomonas extremaustralis TaxID=359110 RepID=A0A5M9J259_9PSED|nr:hypothetical protein [Pseudomonas extremaustralis]KAA8562560.1 hypothetical protein FX985_02626 [Pseudomonas extremaustralis]
MKTCPLPAGAPAHLKPLPVPPHYMCSLERLGVREMQGPMGRPEGDHRSAERIIEGSPVMRHFLESVDHYQAGDNLKKQVGDWTEANPDPEARADAAYDLDNVLRFIDNVDDSALKGSARLNGKIDGFSNYGYRVRDNSEASLLSEFSSKGYSALRYLPT